MPEVYGSCYPLQDSQRRRHFAPRLTSINRPAPVLRPEATCLGRSAACVSYDGAAAAEGPSRPLTPIERDLGRGSPSCQDGDSLNIAAGTHYTIHYIGCTS